SNNLLILEKSPAQQHLLLSEHDQFGRNDKCKPWCCVLDLFFRWSDCLYLYNGVWTCVQPAYIILFVHFLSKHSTTNLPRTLTYFQRINRFRCKLGNLRERSH